MRQLDHPRHDKDNTQEWSSPKFLLLHLVGTPSRAASMYKIFFRTHFIKILPQAKEWGRCSLGVPQVPLHCQVAKPRAETGHVTTLCLSFPIYKMERASSLSYSFIKVGLSCCFISAPAASFQHLPGGGRLRGGNTGKKKPKEDSESLVLVGETLIV